MEGAKIMLKEVKKCAENHDIRGLRYIFLDCLDVDPTFEKYREDYEYCKSVSGMFERHQELSGISQDRRDWTKKYWEQLKLDLMKNFSQLRFEHMIDVARVVYADKVARLLEERRVVQPKETASVVPFQGQRSAVNPPNVSDKKLQEEKVEQRKRELAEENRRVAEKKAREQDNIKAQQQKLKNEGEQQRGEFDSKKAIGVVILVIIIVVFLMIIIW